MASACVQPVSRSEKGIAVRHPPLGIAGYDGVANGVERNEQPFLAFRQSDIDLLQLLIRLLLYLKQMLSFEMHQILEPLLCLLIDQISKPKRKQQRKHGCGNNDGK